MNMEVRNPMGNIIMTTEPSPAEQREAKAAQLVDDLIQSHQDYENATTGVAEAKRVYLAQKEHITALVAIALRS
jgi:hypothetical protein